MTKYEYMELALKLAKKGLGRTSPNPMVGCVVVKDGKIVTEGYHHRYGDFHAERVALNKCEEDLTGADMYVTLEPCCHQGKTPPCTDIIIERGIGRVFIGAMDPKAGACGSLINIVQDDRFNHRAELETGILEEECRGIVQKFFIDLREKRKRT